MTTWSKEPPKEAGWWFWRKPDAAWFPPDRKVVREVRIVKDVHSEHAEVYRIAGLWDLAAEVGGEWWSTRIEEPPQ